MLLTPQHFQQQDRYIDYLIQSKHVLHQPYYWGLKHIKFSEELLMAGKLRLLSCIAIFPNGVFYNAPDVDTLPEDFKISEKMIGSVIYLVINHSNAFPYAPFNKPIINTENQERRSANVTMGQLQVKLSEKILKNQSDKALQITQVQSINERENIALSTKFIPPCLDYRVSPALDHSLAQVGFLLKKLLSSYMQRITVDPTIPFKDVKTYILVRSLNRFSVYLSQVKNDKNIHPYQLHSQMMCFLSELALHDFSLYHWLKSCSYKHDQAGVVFNSIIEKMIKLLGQLSQSKAIKITMISKNNNIWVSERVIPPLSSLRKLILSVYVPNDLEVVKSIVLREIKIAPLDKIHNLVCHALPGMPLKVIKTLPADFTYEADTIYFSVLPTNEEDSKPESLACHFNMSIEGLKLSLWYIKES